MVAPGFATFRCPPSWPGVLTQGLQRCFLCPSCLVPVCRFSESSLRLQLHTHPRTVHLLNDYSVPCPGLASVTAAALDTLAVLSGGNDTVPPRTHTHPTNPRN